MVKNNLNDTWREMEALVEQGVVRKIGLCNFSVQMIRQISSTARIPPSVLQVELHLENSQNKLVRFSKESGLRVTGFSALGASSYLELSMALEADIIMANSVVQRIASRHRKTVAQVVIRWAVQRGTLPLTKTSSRARMAENRDVFDFFLGKHDMNQLETLNCNRRYNDPGVFTLGFGVYCPIYE